LATVWEATAAFDVESEFLGSRRIVRSGRIGYEPNLDARAKAWGETNALRVEEEWIANGCRSMR
jgi:hypothetical protein